MSEDGPDLTLFDREGYVRTELGVWDGRPGLILSDPQAAKGHAGPKHKHIRFLY